VERISSRQNAVVKQFRQLIREGPAGGRVLLDGAHLLEEAISSGIPIDLAAFAPPLDGTALAARAAGARARTVVVTPAVLAAISPVKQPSGVAAIARVGPRPLGKVLAHERALLLVLHEVQDPGNVGAAVRAAEACGATGVVTTAGTADPFGWKALRGSMGSALRVPIAARVPLAEIPGALRPRRISLVAALPRGGTPLPDVDLGRPCAIILGAEGAGIPEDVAALADERLSIPMRPPVESLNVAIAAALVLYEAARQRR
jgi:TrmH family RNA methyltransferase